jgi:hypothetical protein
MDAVASIYYAASLSIVRLCMTNSGVSIAFVELLIKKVHEVVQMCCSDFGVNQLCLER